LALALRADRSTNLDGRNDARVDGVGDAVEVGEGDVRFAAQDLAEMVWGNSDSVGDCE